MADFRLGRLKFKWRGDWAASTAYVIDDIVKYGANSYVCTVNHTSNASETGFYTTDIGYFDLHTEGLEQRGDWAPSQWYTLNDVVKYGNTIYRCTTAHTSGSAFTFGNFAIYSEGLVFEDTWASGTLYQKGDVVTYGGYTYIAEQNSTGVAPNTDTAYWKVLTTGYLSQGEYNSAEVYEPGNTVKYGGHTYACKVTTDDEVLNLASASGDGTTATAVFQTTQPSAPYGIGDVVIVAGISEAAYNGTVRVTACTTTGFSYASAASAGGATGGTATYTPVPTNTRFWDLVVEGFNWTGQWNANSVYQLGDVVNRNGNSYVCITSNTLGAATAPELDSNGNYWNYLSQGGDAAQVLQDIGDLIYQAAGGINRIALPAGSTGTAAEQAEASGQILTVGGSPLLPRWEANNTTAPIYYVTKEGSDANNGRSISRGFASLRYACDHIAALTGSDAPSATNPITIYIKAGVYDEVLPITVPAHVSLVGDNLRTSIIQAASGSSNMQALVLASSLQHVKYGDVITNAAETKTAKVLDTDYANNIHLLNISGGEWDVTDKYLDIVSHQSSDAKNLLDANRLFIAHEAWHRLQAVDPINTPVSGDEATVKSRLAEFVDAMAFNVKHGSNNKVYDYITDRLGGNAITATGPEDRELVAYIETIAIQVIRNETVPVTAGNLQTQVKDLTITQDVNAPICATQASAISTLVGLFDSAIQAGSVAGITKTLPYVDISSAVTRTNAESTMLYVGSHTVIKDIIFQGMSGFAPSGTNDKDLDTSTIKGVYLRLDPDSPISKSPYIQNCAAIGGAAVGVMIDGGVHSHFDNTSTPSNKSMVFDSYTQILDNGVGFYVTRGAASEIVSCFTYYAHISYSSTRGGKIRAVSGNSSYGKYGCISRGFDATEATIDGNVKGLKLEFDPQQPKDGSFINGERIVGGTSGAVGELINAQEGVSKIYFFPITGSFVQNEVVTGSSSGAYVTLSNNTSALEGQKGFILTVEGLTAAPDQGGSVELQDNGVNNDSGSYVISNSSYTAPDGRGTLTVERGKLASSPVAHTGTTNFDLFGFVDVADPSIAGQPTTLDTTVDDTTTTLNVNQVSGMTGTSYIIIGTEMMRVTGFGGGTQITVERGVEGTTASSHAATSNVTVLSSKAVAHDEIIEDFGAASTAVRIAQANVIVKAQDYIKVDDEFFRITVVSPDATGIVTLFFSDEKVIAAGDGQDFKIRYRYSQVRLTAHDFLDVGTGDKANTNWPFLPNSPNVPDQETDEDRPGRVYYVSTDQDGNFAVGKYFRVEQATGKATLDASAFDLSGLSTLRLGAIGAQLGATIDEFSTDVTLSQNSNSKVPTQRAVKTYIDALSGVVGDFSIAGNLTVNGTTTSVQSVTVEAKDRNITLGNVTTGTFTGDVTGNTNQITNISDTTNLAPGVVVTLTGAGSSNVTLAANVKVTAVSGTTVTLSENFGGSDSVQGATFSTGGATDFTADTGGITILGTTNKEISWLSSNNAFNISENVNLANGKKLMINGNEVATETTVLGFSFSTDGTLGGATPSDTLAPSQAAVKSYVDAADRVTAINYYLAAI